MDKLKQKFAFKPLTWMLAMAIVFFFGSATGYLQTAPPPAPAPTPAGTSTQEDAQKPDERDINIICQDEFQIFTNERMKEYREWLERHFQNKSSTASLLTVGIGRYEELRKTLMDKSYTYVPHQNALQLTEGLEQAACRKIADTALKEAKRLLESKSRTTSAVKKSTILLNKYQEMNDKISKLSKDFLQMKAYMDTFATKLPCYIKRSCNKG